MRELRYVIAPEQDGVTVGRFLKSLGYSGRTITRLKRPFDGLTANGEHIRTVDVLHAGEVFAVRLYTETDGAAPWDYPISVLYEDADVVVYDKPPGMPVHTCCGHWDDTLENIHAHRARKEGGDPCLRPINRLDADTSGCVLAAKNQYAASRLTGRAEKGYRALVTGEVPSDGRIEAKIFRPNPPPDIRRTVDERGKYAVTEYGVLRKGNGYSFLQFRLPTGRTHQIRVHMAHIGFPVVGDSMYGEADGRIGRQALYCFRVTFLHPVSGNPVTVTAPPPEDIAQAYRQTIGGEIPCGY